MPASTFDEIINQTTQNDISIYKTDDEKRLVFGWASISITVEGEQLEDRQKDMIDPEVLEEAAYEYVLHFRDTGEEHIPTMRKKGKLVESCVFTEEKQRAMGIPEGILPVGWWIGFYIEDDDAWERVKNGTYKMFSIEGKAERHPVEKANPYHDELGRFTSANGGGGASAKVSDGMKDYIAGLEPDVEYPERVEHWKKQIEAGNDRPILVSATDENRVIDGNHTLAAYKELGKTPKVYAMDRIEFLLGASEAKDTVEFIRQAIKDGKATEVKKTATVAKTFDEVLKFNPYHDNRGRFSSANSAASFTFAPGKSKAHDLAIQRERERHQAAMGAAGGEKAPEEKVEYKNLNFNSANALAKKMGQNDMSKEDVDQMIAHKDGGYFGTGHSFHMNKDLRDHKPLEEFSEDDQKTIETLDRNMKPCPENIQIFRTMGTSVLGQLGMDKDGAINGNDTELQKAVGKVFSSGGFTSTSYDMKENVFKGRPVKLNISAPKGTKLLFRPDGDEAEVLLARNTAMQVTGIKRTFTTGWSGTKKQQIQVDCEVIVLD